MRLNPFEFRAGIYLPAGFELADRLGLNPFEFRAGIYFGAQVGQDVGELVLIPLNSGLVFTWLFHAK